MFQWLYQFFGTIIKFIYLNTGQNYGLALILFTVVVKILLLPLGIKQQRSMAVMQKLQPQMQELQRKYKNDKEKLNTETMELYKKNNANPMGGCLPMIFQLVILLVMIRVVYQPATYIMGVEGAGKDLSAQIQAAVQAGMNFNFLGIDLSQIPKFSLSPSGQQLILWILPILATVATYLSGKISQTLTGNPNAPANNAQPDQAQAMSKSMTTIFPVITLFFTFTMPLSASLYWFISSITQVIQQYALTKILVVNVDEGGKAHGKHH